VLVAQGEMKAFLGVPEKLRKLIIQIDEQYGGNE